MGMATTDAALNAVLRTTDTEGLLAAIIRLTHTIHGTSNDSVADELRRQRRVVMDEVHRRTVLHDMALPDPRLPGLTHVSRSRIEREEATP